MTHELMVDLDWADGSLCRLTGLIEQRGFRIDRLELFPMGSGRRADILVSAIDEARNIDVLQRQVERLLSTFDGELAPMKCVTSSNDGPPLVA